MGFGVCGARGLRVLLALLLTLSPLLSVAQPSAITTTTGSATAATDLPCHATQAQGTQVDGPDEPRGCPHCSSDAAYSLCGCCVPLSPVTPASLVAHAFAPSGSRLLGIVTHHEALPESPAETLYRPPIVRG